MQKQHCFTAHWIQIRHNRILQATLTATMKSNKIKENLRLGTLIAVKKTILIVETKTAAWSTKASMDAEDSSLLTSCVMNPDTALTSKTLQFHKVDHQ